MNTTTASTQSTSITRIKSFWVMVLKLLRVTADSTQAPMMVATPLRPSLADQAVMAQASVGYFKGNNAKVWDVDGDPHGSMDALTEMQWLEEHTLPHDVPGEHVLLKLDELLQERLARHKHEVTGSYHLDTKRLRMHYRSEEHVVRKVEFVTRRPDGQVPKNEHPELSHEWHKYFLVFSSEGYIVDLVKA